MTIQFSRRTVALAVAAFLAFAAVATTSLVLTLSRDADAGGGFSDTPPWIAAHAAWLQDNGIADGFDDGTFKPNNNITRGQAAYWFGNYNNSLELVETSVNSPGASSSHIHTTECPAGKRALIGGGDTSHNDLFMAESYPKDKTAGDTGWTVRWETDDNAVLNPFLLRVWALCVPKTLTG